SLHCHSSSFFFLISSVSHRDLPSFPTRRSSDLCHVITVTQPLLAKLPWIGRDLDEVSLDTVRMFYDDACAAKYALGSPRVRAAGDRKSTRLNSSHGSISYAVFCLKKKKKKYEFD